VTLRNVGVPGGKLYMEFLVGSRILKLQLPLLVRRHHRHALVQLAYDLGHVRAYAVGHSIKPHMRICPEGKPKLTPEQKREAEQAERERQKRSDRAAFVTNASNERHRLRLELAARQAAPEEVERALREHTVASCIERAYRGYGLPFSASIVEEAKRRALEDNEVDPFPMDPRNIIAMFKCELQ
jgi:hypothetical protein